MAKEKSTHYKNPVDAYIEKLEPSTAKLVNTIRKFILSVDDEIGEHIKWNSPAFFFTGEMKPFDPKEYKRDLVVLNMRKGSALLVFPTGAKIQDKSGLLEGNYTDGRRLVTFHSEAEVKSKSKQLKDVIQDWLKKIDE